MRGPSLDCPLRFWCCYCYLRFRDTELHKVALARGTIYIFFFELVLALAQSCLIRKDSHVTYTHDIDKAVVDMIFPGCREI